MFFITVKAFSKNNDKLYLMSKIFGENLKSIRKENHFTQENLAKILNVSKMTISAWEADKQEPSIDNIVRIALIFRTTSDFLLGLEDEFGNKNKNTYNNYGIHNGDVNF